MNFFLSPFLKLAETTMLAEGSEQFEWHWLLKIVKGSSKESHLNVRFRNSMNERVVEGRHKKMVQQK